MRSSKATCAAIVTLVSCALILIIEFRFCGHVNIADHKAEPDPTGAPSSSSNASADAAAPKFHVEFKTEPAQVSAGKSADLIFKVKNEQGATVNDLLFHHEKLMHLLIISGDMEEFYHIHPAPQPDGSYKVAQTFPKGGIYKLFADCMPLESVQIVEKLELRVAGDSRERKQLPTKTKLIGANGGIRVALSTDRSICPGEDVTLGFKVTEARTGAPVKDLQPYLGEFAHFVTVSKNFEEFLHVHPSSEGTGNDSHDNASPSEIFAQTTFPIGGMFKIWAQFKRKEEIITIPFVINTSPSNCSALAAVKGNNHTRRNNATSPEDSSDLIKVNVSSDGYTPNRVEVERGRPVKLAFYRADARNCGGTVVFTSLNIRQKLPVGEQKIVEITPRETGDISFTCSMGMLKGKLAVK